MFDDDDIIGGLKEDDIEPHRVDDPSVWGLIDVIRGRTPNVPTTIYKIAGNSASGVVGRLVPPDQFFPINSSRQGRAVTLTQDGETFTVETVWDGATKTPEFTVELPNGALETRQSRSKGLLLADYASGVAVQHSKTSRRGLDGNQRRENGNWVTFAPPQGQLRLPKFGGLEEAA